MAPITARYDCGMDVDRSDARRVGETMESLLLAPILAPVFGASTALGGYGLDLIAREIARHDDRGFAALVAAQFQRGQ